MNKLAFILLALLPLSASAQSDADNDFGLDLSVAAEKKLAKNLDFALDASLRTQDNTSAMERWGIGGAFSLKVLNTKKFDVKLSAGYEFIRQNMLAENELSVDKEEYNTPSGMVTSYLYEEKCSSAYWRTRHRATFGTAASYSPNKRWSFSLKETVQYNHYNEATKHIIRYSWENDDPKELESEKDKTMKAKDRTVLRSKFATQYNIRHSHFSPYAAIDYGCGLNYTTNKWRFSVGTDYKISKNSKLDVSYRFQTEDDDDEPNGHLVSIGYKIKL